LDDVLDPADKEELSQKIETSDFAEELVHRTRDTMRRLRLSAPQVVGTGMGLDPNSVAEYLDNMLPPDQVGDYERICLESDVHLAEAAACHHVLTMVLGEPADVDPRSRQRMYRIPAEARERKQLRVEPAHAAHTAQRSAAVAPTIDGSAVLRVPASATMPISHQATAAIEIPEYLRTRSWWQSRGVLAALAAVLLIGISLYFGSGIMGWFGGEKPLPPLTAGPANNDASPAPANVPEENQTAESNSDTPPLDAAMSSAPSTQPAATLPPLGPPPQPGTPGIMSAPAAAPAEAPAVTAAEPDRYAFSPEANSAASDQEIPPPAATTGGPASEKNVAATNADSTTATVGVQENNTSPASPYDVPTNEGPAAAIPLTGDVPLEAAVPNEPVVDADALIEVPAATGPKDAAASEPGAAPDADASVEVPAGPPELGTYLGGSTVLLRYDEQTGAWMRVEPRAAAVAGQRLLSLPEFRPKITLASGVHLDMAGGTQVAIETGDQVTASGLPAVAANVPAIDVIYGRIILINPTMAEQQLRLKLGPSVSDARLARNSTLAIEVEPQYVPGNDPRQAPSPMMVQLYAPDGGVTWQDAAGEKSIDTASRWSISGGVTSEIVADDAPPAWIEKEPVVYLSEQRFGAPVVESTLVSNRPVDTQLLELFQGSGRKEVKSLVARSSIHVGLFEPFVDALRDSEQKANWKTHINALRSAMAAGPESAKKVHKALVEQRGERVAADLYEMLCGYNAEQIGKTPDEVKAGALARLVNWLEEDSLDYRVLAVHDLAEITGKRLMSNPAAGAPERAQNIRRWRSRLESGELRPVSEEGAGSEAAQ